MELKSSDNSHAEITINYETLYELLRREKRKDEIQDIDQNFFLNLVDYLNNKLSLLEDNRNKHDLFSSTEKSETRTQVGNIKRLIKELYERREKKIILMALNKSRTGSNIIDTSNLLKEEQKFFNEIITSLDRFRKGVMIKLMSAQLPDIMEKKESPEMIDKDKEDDSTLQETSEKEEKETTLIRFLKPVPKFVGKELEIYGPFEEEDMANLPTEIANVLIAKERAEKIES